MIEGSIGYPKSIIYSINTVTDRTADKSRPLIPLILRQALIYLFSEEIDNIKACYFCELNHIPNKYSNAGKPISQTQIMTILNEFDKNNLSPALHYYTLNILHHSVSSKTYKQCLKGISENISSNFKNYLICAHFLDLFIDHNKDIPKSNISQIFYWRSPHIQVLLKYISKSYQDQPFLQLFFTKTMKRLFSEQIIFYLPQIYVSLGTRAGPIIKQFLIEEAELSVLFQHQIMWLARVESSIDFKKGSGSIPGNIQRIVNISKGIIEKVQRDMDADKQEFFYKVNQLYESVTAISNSLHPKMPKPAKKKIINEQLLKLSESLPHGIYMVTNPRYRIIRIDAESGLPMQSAAKCPIMITFICEKYEGPDKYFQRKVEQKKERIRKKQNYFQENFCPEDEEKLEKAFVQYLLKPFATKGFPSVSQHQALATSQSMMIQGNNEDQYFSKQQQQKESNKSLVFSDEEYKSVDNINLQGTATPLNRKINPYNSPISNKQKSNGKKDYESLISQQQLMKDNSEQKQLKNMPTIYSEDIEISLNQSFQNQIPQLQKEQPSQQQQYNSYIGNDRQSIPFKIEQQLLSFKKPKSQQKQWNKRFTFNFDNDSQIATLQDKTLVVQIKENEQNQLNKVQINSFRKRSSLTLQGQRERKEKEVSCIFKVKDDIRKDQLALQIIHVFKCIFEREGLDLYVFPYKTISTRTGAEEMIGGIIECVKNEAKSRDELGKGNQCDLYTHFVQKFGSEDKSNFQIARENFIKSLAPYSIIQYILQIKDRHNGNILINNKGHLIHIDFGFIFDISPAHNLKFERANFKLTKEMIKIIGGSKESEPFQFFMNLTIRAFLAIRKFSEHIYNMIALMYDSTLDCFMKESLENLQLRFVLEKNDIEAAIYIKDLIYHAYENPFTSGYDLIQQMQNKIYW